MNVGIYPRVSTQEQALNGHSIDEQIERCRKYCDAMRWNVYRIYTDAGFSGASLSRPGLQQLIRDVKDGKLDKVLVYKLDRLSRSQKDTLYLIEDVFLPNKVDFVSMSENFDTSSAFGRAMIGILSVFAQLEREQIKERMQMGKEARAKQGGFSGARFTPTGYDYVDGQLIPNEYEALQVRRVFDRVQALDPLSRIASDMNNAGMRPRTGKWTPQLIRRMVTSRTYVGDITFDGQWFAGRHEPIITREQFDAVQKIMKLRSEQHQDFNRRPANARTYLSGFLVCAQCGAKYMMWTQHQKRKNGSEYFRQCYCCNSRHKRDAERVKDPNCKNKNWLVSDLTDLVFGEIRKLAMDPDYIPSMQSRAEESSSSDNEILKSEIKSLSAQIDRLLDLYALGTVPIASVQQRIADLSDKRSALEEQIAAMENKKDELPTPAEIVETARSFDEVLSRGDFVEIRAVLAELISYIEIDNDNIIIHWKFL
jgi:site-specific DNA recombinase